ncbi:MAG TPA: hypothetical protein DDX29_05995 [Clostridiales bacterium]|nr:hypothetical protein [Clostridiales bacterium]
MKGKVRLNYFSDVFNVDVTILDRYGAINICLCQDLPLFLDPFLLYYSSNPDFNNLHGDVIEYLSFLKKKSKSIINNNKILRQYFTFKEIKQNWLGYTRNGNAGKGLGLGFAQEVNSKLSTTPIQKTITKGIHFERIFLSCYGVGVDKTSDFTTNLCKRYLLDYTEYFAKTNISPSQCKSFSVQKVYFDYKKQEWQNKDYYLPSYKGDFVILTPKQMLSRAPSWINRYDLINNFDSILETAIPDSVLGRDVSKYLSDNLPETAKKREKNGVIKRVLEEYSGVYDYYILNKEMRGNEAVSKSRDDIQYTEQVFIHNTRDFISKLHAQTDFYKVSGDTFTELKKKILILKDFIESTEGQKLFYHNGKPIIKEEDITLLHRLISCPSDSKVDNTRSRDGAKGAGKRVNVELKLASNPQLKKYFDNKMKQSAFSGGAIHTIFVIICYSEEEFARALEILHELEIRKRENIIFIKVGE